MTTPSDAMPNDAAGLPGQAVAPAALTPTRPFLWSVRRELWENGSIWIAPLAAAGVVLFGFLLALAHLSSRVPTFEIAKGVNHRLPAEAPYAVVAFVIIVTAAIVGVFYCLGALHNERRDRSILFWKSLPVSDLTTVLSKVFIPMVVLPVVAWVVICAMWAIIFVASAASAAASGSALAALMTQAPIVSMAGGLAYGLAVMALWYAPIWGWCLLVGGWARRVAFLWAVLPPLALCVIERIAFGTSVLTSMLKQRFNGGVAQAFSEAPHSADGTALQIDLVGFLSSPGLWIGLAIGAAFVAAAVWLRRYRDPI
jgi:ABC-2 type transport system permease protein